MESFAEVWNSVKQWFLDQNVLSNVAFNLWICCLEPVKLKEGRATFSVRSDFQKSIIEERYLSLIKDGFVNVLGFDVDIDIITAAEDENNEMRTSSSFKTSAVFGSGNEYEYTFDTFIVGSSNKFAHAASLAVASNPSGAYNPLFIYGGSGLGKTHLLYAICNEIAANHSDYNIIYVKGEEFTNKLIEAIRNESTQDFHEKYRQADVLAVDDIQFIGGKERTQEEFFHTFEALYQSGKQIILSSDRAPKEIKTLEDRLRTRFEMGLLADVQPPDLETRIAIIKRKAELIDINIPSEVAEFIANKLKSNIRQLEGTVKKLKAYKLLTNTSPSIALAQVAIKDILTDNQPVPLTVERIIGEVSRSFGVSVSDIRSQKREAKISKARQVAVYIVRNITQLSMADIGKEFGDRDHSTIVYTIQQAERSIKKNSALKETVDDIIRNIKNS